MNKAFNSDVMMSALIVSGFCGVVAGWNLFLIGESRTNCSMVESRMIPRRFFLIAPKQRTKSQQIFRVKHYKFVGITATNQSGSMVLLHLVPESGCFLKVEE